MKRWIAAAAVALTAPAIAAAAAPAAGAQTAPKAPNAALKAFAVQGNGAKVTDSLTTTLKSSGVKLSLKGSATGTVAFGKGRITGFDVTGRYAITPVYKQELVKAMKEANEGSTTAQIENLYKPARTVVDGASLYYNGAYFTEALPEGKTWVHTKPTPAPRYERGSLFSVFDAKAYNVIQARAKRAPGGTVDGVKTTVLKSTITLGELRKVSSTIREFYPKVTAAEAKAPVTIKVWLGSDLLPRRVVTTVTTKVPDLKGTNTVTQDTRLSGWAKGVTIKAPAAEGVAELSDLDLSGFSKIRPWDFSSFSIG
ncbi:hypothetical protein SAMN05421505_11719 [Sinosporangium album]|uniref:DUF2092 domain-containing protein n=1 Tax=Sinosporangium album TaxID=504805 RepID=A0A1G8CWY3_9ACTN|nr:hypothetical protein [Sinosporangium album]SDH50047.1 hypothetical protein SAMN05421505_11719 [Sinosporangium album]